MQVVKFGVYNKLDSCGEIEGQWTQVMEKYDMLTNKHAIGLYQIKHFWVPCYLRGHFFLWNDNNRKIGKYKCLY